ncbi:DUF1028 domain-containing protein [Arthrobacter sp. MI7-26]|uniref:DUF1028 domain-containing protein n=1 Tax=Arthrobacter sp. MI7-26 TaxID=2993653 RepID=UPI00224925DD|nr:DUF1028 domain-containing protein [Arthrobacter sp. MI7-26]MCX2750044.1 DUF1028 domain-containing protein [Arthrobacter sp. MI7-26]
MTYTVMGKCAETGAIGIAITTASANVSKTLPTVRGLVPTIQQNGAIVCSQSMGNPMLPHKAFELLDQGKSFDEFEQSFAADDEYLQFRQIGIVTVSGDVWAFTGDTCFPEKGHFVGDDYLVMGNCLGPNTLAAMKDTYESGAGTDLAERLLSTLEAGRAAGGQYWEGEPIPELFCSLSVYDGLNPYPKVDMRVDFDLSAVEKMRRMYDQLQSRTETYFETMHRRPHEFKDTASHLLLEVAGKQI